MNEAKLLFGVLLSLLLLVVIKEITYLPIEMPYDEIVVLDIKEIAAY